VKHIFLTGEIGIGKTTVLTKAIEAAIGMDAVTVDEIVGFRTVWRKTRRIGDGEGSSEEPCAEGLYILPYDAGRLTALSPAGCATDEDVPAGFRPAALRDARSRSFAVYPEVFDEDGAAILLDAAGSSPAPKRIIMDELGFMESDARAFQNAVISVLGGSIPILGVLRLDSTPFLESVKAHGNVNVTTVDTANRDKLPMQIAEHFLRD